MSRRWLLEDASAVRIQHLFRKFAANALVRQMRGASGSKRRGPGVCVGVCVWFGLVLALSLG